MRRFAAAIGLLGALAAARPALAEPTEPRVFVAGMLARRRTGDRR